MQKILIVEDDKWISQSLKLYLENSNFTVHLYYEWAWALDEIKKVWPDLLILDINLPWMSWIEIAKQIRINSSLPIIILTARWGELDRIIWLEIWADDYIAKPFSPRELLARINTILRRLKTEYNTNIISYGNVIIDIDKKNVKLNNIDISLTWNEFDILKIIVEKNWKLVKRETLMTEAIWYDKYIYDRTIDTHIKNLRKKLWNKDLILTVRWEWYRLNK